MNAARIVLGIGGVLCLIILVLAVRVICESAYHALHTRKVRAHQRRELAARRRSKRQATEQAHGYLHEEPFTGDDDWLEWARQAQRRTI